MNVSIGNNSLRQDGFAPPSMARGEIRTIGVLQPRRSQVDTTPLSGLGRIAQQNRLVYS
jgi:hypothetical protein